MAIFLNFHGRWAEYIGLINDVCQGCFRWLNQNALEHRPVLSRRTDFMLKVLFWLNKTLT